MKSANTTMSQADALILQAKYNIALEEGKDSFLLYGQEILVGYAKYLIEHLTHQGVLKPDVR